MPCPAKDCQPERLNVLVHVGEVIAQVRDEEWFRPVPGSGEGQLLLPDDILDVPDHPPVLLVLVAAPDLQRAALLCLLGLLQPVRLVPDLE